MASHLDLEEQEQLDQLKHFWKTYGNLITWALIVALGAYAAFNGWQWWQRSQAAKAAGVHEEIERALQAGDLGRAEQMLADARDKFGGTLQAQQAALQVAQAAMDKGQPDKAKAALTWAADKGTDAGLQAVARLRLAAVLADAKAYDEALKVLAADVPSEFAGLAADRRGDIYSLQGKKAEAKAEYGKAWKALAAQADYRRLLEYKLGVLGVDAASLDGAAKADAAAGAKS